MVSLLECCCRLLCCALNTALCLSRASSRLAIENGKSSLRPTTPALCRPASCAKDPDVCFAKYRPIPTCVGRTSSQRRSQKNLAPRTERPKYARAPRQLAIRVVLCSGGSPSRRSVTRGARSLGCSTGILANISSMTFEPICAWRKYARTSPPHTSNHPPYATSTKHKTPKKIHRAQPLLAKKTVRAPSVENRRGAADSPR